MTIPRIAPYPLPQATELPQNRVRWRPHPQRAALLIHDMQEYFLDFYDRSAHPIPELIAQVERLRQAAYQLAIPVIYTAQPAQQSAAERGLLNDLWGPGLTALPESDGRAAIAAPLAPGADDTVLVKWRYSAFQRSPLQQLLEQQGRDQLIICGVYAHIGCQATAVDAFMRDIQPFLVADACADFSAPHQQQALNYVAQRCGVTLSLADLLQQLQAPQGEGRWSFDTLRQRVAGLLQIPATDLQGGDNLLDWGLDSIRTMTLMNGWQRLGAAIELPELAEAMTLDAWWQLLQQRLPARHLAEVPHGAT